jgi:hypothetical protein
MDLVARSEGFVVAGQVLDLTCCSRRWKSLGTVLQNRNASSAPPALFPPTADIVALGAPKGVHV